MNLLKPLQEYGLTQKQAKIYLACLELGSSSVTEIARKSELARTTCFDTLEQLKKQGLVSFFIKKKIGYYGVEEPKKIIDQAQERAKKLESIFPQLKSLYATAKNRPGVKFYIGKQGMRQVIEEILNIQGEMLTLCSIDDWYNQLGEYWDEYNQKRKQAKILNKVILRDSSLARQKQSTAHKGLRQVKIIPKSFKFHGMMIIFGDRVALFSFKKDLVALIVESQEISQMMRVVLEGWWGSLK